MQSGGIGWQAQRPRWAAGAHSPVRWNAERYTARRSVLASARPWLRSGERSAAPDANGGANSAAYDVWNGRTRPSPSVSWLTGGLALSCLPAGTGAGVGCVPGAPVSTGCGTTGALQRQGLALHGQTGCERR